MVSLILRILGIYENVGFGRYKQICKQAKWIN